MSHSQPIAGLVVLRQQIDTATPAGTARVPPARRSPPDRDQLWLGITQHGEATVSAGPAHRNVIRRWIARHGVTGEDGQLLALHRHRIRTTHLSMRDKSTWKGSGRAAIDPNHSPQVEGDNYLTAATPAQHAAFEAIIEDAQHDLARRAEPPAVITEETAAALAAGYPRLAASLQLGCP